MYSRCLLLLVALVTLGCHTSNQVLNMTPTDRPIEKKARITLKDGKQTVLTRVEITDTKVLGRDEKGNQYEESLENIDKITLFSDSKTKRIIISSILALSIAAVIYYALGMQGFSDLR